MTRTRAIELKSTKLRPHEVVELCDRVIAERGSDTFVVVPMRRRWSEVRDTRKLVGNGPLGVIIRRDKWGQLVRFESAVELRTAVEEWLRVRAAPQG